MSPPPVWGEMAKWVGELGSVARGWQTLWSKCRVKDGCVGDVYSPVPWGHPSNQETNSLTNLNLRPMGRKKKWRWVSGTKNKQTSNCILQYFFFYSRVFFLFPSFFFFKTLKLESSVAPHAASFLRLAKFYTLWNPAWMTQKIIIATMRIYCIQRVTLLGHFCCGL